MVMQMDSMLTEVRFLTGVAELGGIQMMGSIVFIMTLLLPMIVVGVFLTVINLAHLPMQVFQQMGWDLSGD